MFQGAQLVTGKPARTGARAASVSPGRSSDLREPAPGATRAAELWNSP